MTELYLRMKTALWICIDILFGTGPRSARYRHAAHREELNRRWSHLPWSEREKMLRMDPELQRLVRARNQEIGLIVFVVAGILLLVLRFA